MPLKVETAPAGHPRSKGSHKDIIPGSPSALLGIYAAIIQTRFDRVHGLPWVYDANLTNASTETGQTDGPRKLMVASMYNPNVEPRNYRPAIIIGHGDITPRQVVIGHVAGMHLPSGMVGYYTEQNVVIDIEVISSSKGECGQIADTVQAYLMCNRQIIREICGFRDMSLPFLGAPQPNDRDKKEFISHVRQEVQVVFRWRTMPIAPVLREAIIRLKDTGLDLEIDLDVRSITTKDK